MQHGGLSGQACGTNEEATDEEATDDDGHILPLTGLNAFVYTGLNAQKLLVVGWTVGRTEISGRPYSKSTCGANNKS